jgi:hypothetical protein
MTDAEIIEALTAEILAKADAPMALTIAPSTAFQLAALVQLALRHPDLPPEPRATATRVLMAVREYFADCPTVLATLDRGETPAPYAWPPTIGTWLRRWWRGY